MPVLTPARMFSLSKIVLLVPSLMLDVVELMFQGIRPGCPGAVPIPGTSRPASG